MAENRLSDPAKIDEASYAPFIAAETLWLAELDGAVAGFAGLDLPRCQVWALFVAPSQERRGIGRALLARLISEARSRDLQRLELTTQAGSRAERLYAAAGWTRVGLDADGDVRLSIDLKRRPRAASPG